MARTIVVGHRSPPSTLSHTPHSSAQRGPQAETAPRMEEWDGRILLLGLEMIASATEVKEFIYAHLLPSSCCWSSSSSTPAQPPSCSRTGVSTCSQAWPTWAPCSSVRQTFKNRLNNISKANTPSRFRHRCYGFSIGNEFIQEGFRPSGRQ